MRGGLKLTNGVKAADSRSLTSQCRWLIDCSAAATLPIFFPEFPNASSPRMIYIKSYFTRGGDQGGLHDRVHLREDQCWGNSGWGDEPNQPKHSKPSKILHPPSTRKNINLIIIALAAPYSRIMVRWASARSAASRWWQCASLDITVQDMDTAKVGRFF